LRLLLQRGSCCEVCGILAHESCARHVPDDCRPIALPAEKVLHTWKAAGTVLVENQVSSQGFQSCRQVIPMPLFSSSIYKRCVHSTACTAASQPASMLWSLTPRLCSYCCCLAVDHGPESNPRWLCWELKPHLSFCIVAGA